MEVSGQLPDIATLPQGKKSWYPINGRLDGPQKQSGCFWKDWSLTHPMEQSPSWETNLFSASQEIPRILWSLKVHYCIHKCLPPVPILNQLDAVHNPTSYFLEIHLNIIPLSMPASPKWSLSFRFPHRNLVHTSPFLHTCNMSRPSHSSRFYHLDNIRWGIQIIQLLIM